MWLDRRTRVGTLRVRGAGADVPALRLAAAGRLGTAALELPASAPPSAILLVRELRDPLPGRFPRRGAPAPDRAWERAAQAELAELHRAAARPHRGELPADAPAVLFRDEAELIAVAALHLAHGGGPGSWWWRALLRFLPPAALAGTAPLLLAAEPQAAAAALAELYRLGREEAVLARLGDGEAQRLVDAVAAACSLPRPAAGGPLGIVPPQRETDEGGESVRRRRAETGAETATAPPAAPWRGWLPAARSAPLTPARELLLAVAVGREAAPAALRQGAFWRLAAAWREHAAHATIADGSAAAPVRSDVVETATEAPAPVRRKAELPRETGERRGPRARPARSTPHAWERVAEVAAGPVDDEPEVQAAALTPEAAEAGAEARLETATVATATPPPAAGPEPTAFDRWPESGVASGLGGAFYLVHLLRRLDLPAACEDRWRLATRLGGWGTLDALARALAPADAATDPLTDPLWRLLARLAGRDANEPPSLTGDGPPPPFSPPAAWAGDLGLVPADGVFDPTLPTLSPLDAHLGAWLAGAVPWAAAALLDALGEAGGDPRGRLAELLRLPCTVFVTATHVDVVAALDGISLPARRAGLDRDPGWVPRLGRIIQLHFR